MRLTSAKASKLVDIKYMYMDYGRQIFMLDVLYCATLTYVLFACFCHRVLLRLPNLILVKLITVKKKLKRWPRCERKKVETAETKQRPDFAMRGLSRH